MLEEDEKTELPGSWEREETTKRHEKETVVYSDQMTGSMLKLCHGFSPNYHHCYAHYTDMYGRLFSESWGDREEPELTRGELAAFGMSIMRNRTVMDTPEESHFKTKKLKNLEQRVNALFDNDGLWQTADKPIDERGIVQKSKPNIRTPTPKEWQMLVDYLKDGWGLNQQEAVQNLQDCRTVVIGNYRSDCPGYSGPIIITFGGYISAYEVRILDKDYETGEVKGLKRVRPEWCTCE